MLSPLAASPSPLATQTQRAQTQSKPQTRPQSTTIMEQRSGTSSNVAQGRLDKQDAKLLSIARDGVLGEFSEDFLEDVEGLLQLGNSLEDAVAKAKDDQRADKIARIEQRIEALKERLKFASPAQAKALIRELKQLGQDFKLAAQSLSDGGSKAAAGQSAAGSSITLSASSSSASSRMHPRRPCWPKVRWQSRRPMPCWVCRPGLIPRRIRRLLRPQLPAEQTHRRLGQRKPERGGIHFCTAASGSARGHRHLQQHAGDREGLWQRL
ncbi:hypothetical protein V6L77_10545 [Pannonibacter sp. Pt2-lr]